jgi:4-amino-4-deoxy-L-arabinose transferase-like glycosyltransferase
MVSLSRPPSPAPHSPAEVWLAWGSLALALLLYTSLLGHNPLQYPVEVATLQSAILGQEACPLGLPASAPLQMWLVVPLSRLAGFSAWTLRFPGALSAAFALPLLATTARELFPQVRYGIWSALIFLGLLPVGSQVRLGVPAGLILLSQLLCINALLKLRRDPRWAPLLGLSLGALLCCHSLLALISGAIALLFLATDTPRLLSNPSLWLGLSGGLVLPLLALRAWNCSGLIYPPLPLSETALWLTVPWLIPWIWGVMQLWQQRAFGYARLLLIWQATVVLSLGWLRSPEPLVLLWPAFALTIASQLSQPQLAQAVTGGSLDHRVVWPQLWSPFLLGAAVLVLASTGLLRLGWPGLALGLGSALTAGLVLQQEPLALGVLTWSSLVAMGLTLWD